jgi:RNA-binding protein with serine-rich domain 1
MSTRGRSASPQSRGVDVDMDKQSDAKPDAKVIVITNLTRNVVEAHLQAIFGFYGEVVKIDLPTYAKCALLLVLLPFLLPTSSKCVFIFF